MPVVSAASTATKGPKQLSDQNSQGTVLGASSTDLIGFYGANPGIVQPASQGSLKGYVGVVTTYAVTLTPVSVAANTAAEQTLTVTGLATGQLVVVTKPTTQAGLALSPSARVSATNTLAVNFGNDTAAAITPTAGETYLVTAIPATMLLTATLTPSAVGPNTAIEQQFTVTGLAAGSPVIVNKAASQAGLAILGARAVAANTLGITYQNLTAATITPTAAESYLVYASPEIQVAPVLKTVTATLTPTSVAANTTVEQTFTVNGINANMQIYVNKPTFTTGLGIGGYRVSAANTVAITYVNNTSAAIVPPSESYTIGVFPGAVPAAGSSTAYTSMNGGPTADHASFVSLGLIAGP